MNKDDEGRLGLCAETVENGTRPEAQSEAGALMNPYLATKAQAYDFEIECIIAETYMFETKRHKEKKIILQVAWLWK